MDIGTRETLVAWVNGAALEGIALRELLAGFCARLLDAGVPLSRGVLGVDTLHPTLEGYFFEWRPQQDEVRQVEYSRDQAAQEIDRWRQSPFHRLHETGQKSLRRRIERGEGIDEFPVIPELRADGVTDYFCLRHRFGDRSIGDVDAVYSSWTTRMPGGFIDAHIAALEILIPTLAVAVKAASYGQIARNLAETYLGRDVGQRVLAGEISRGKAERIEAVVWFSDLASYTRITDSAMPDTIIPLLNDYAEAVVDAIHAMKGEVLKFIGDGVLALFRSPSNEESCRRALAAALEARRHVAAVNERRTARQAPVTSIYLGLHLGEMFFGNIGSADRLDFTAVGPAVNETSRVVAMCRSLDQEILVSANFAANAGDAGARLISVGRYALRGVSRPQELFTLDPEIAA